MPLQNYLVLIQLILTAYLLENWLLNPPQDSKKDTTARLQWQFWIVLEIWGVLSTIPNCILYLLLRTFGLELSDPDTVTDEKDIIE